MEDKFKSRQLNILFKTIVCFLLSILMIIPMADLPAYSDNDATPVDKFGLHIRNQNGKYPSWYPEDTGSSKGFHDSEIPRVVDMADILSPDEEEALKSKIAQYSTEVNKDIVVVTDRSAYGLGQKLKNAWNSMKDRWS